MERVEVLIELLRGRARRVQVKDADQMAGLYPPPYLNRLVLSSLILTYEILLRISILSGRPS
jgi:hypothetical protein